MVDVSKINAFVNALNAKFENKQSNKKTDIAGDFSNDTTSYPTVQAVKNWVGTQMSSVGSIILGETSDTAYRGDRGKTAYDHTLLTNNPHSVTKTQVGLSNVTNVAQAPATHVGDSTHLTNEQITAINSISDKVDSEDLADVATSGDYDDLINKPAIPTKTSDLTNDSNFLTSQNLNAKEDIVNKKSSWSSPTTNTSYPSEKLVKDSLDDKVDKVSGKQLSTNDFTDTYKDALDNLGTNLNTKTVTVEKKTTAETGYVASYVVKQNGTQVGSTINVPKDYLVKSASVGTVSNANDPVTGYQVGDKYLDFIINTKDNTGTNEHLYVLVSDLIDTYTAGSGLTLSNANEFSISNGAISLSMLASGVQTSLGYADAWNSSAAKGITSSDITAWNGKSNLTTSDVDSEIEAYLTAITTALE